MRPQRLATVLGVVALASLGACAQKMDQPTMAASQPAAMPTDPMVGGAAMYPSKDIIDNAVNSRDHTTLVAAVKAAGLVDTLKGPGPFTVFAPTNEAFDKLPPGTVQSLLKPQNKRKLVSILTYHVVPGRLDVAQLSQMIAAGGGRATLTTVNGAPLYASKDANGGVVIMDSHGDRAMVTIPDVYQSNGVIDVVDTVLLPPG